MCYLFFFCSINRKEQAHVSIKFVYTIPPGKKRRLHHAPCDKQRPICYNAIGKRWRELLWTCISATMPKNGARQLHARPKKRRRSDSQPLRPVRISKYQTCSRKKSCKVSLPMSNWATQANFPSLVAYSPPCIAHVCGRCVSMPALAQPKNQINATISYCRTAPLASPSPL